jgi:hypothetical protein
MAGKDCCWYSVEAMAKREGQRALDQKRRAVLASVAHDGEWNLVQETETPGPQSRAARLPTTRRFVHGSILGSLSLLRLLARS